MNLTDNDIAKALDITSRGVRKRGQKEGWPFIVKKGNGGEKKLYPLSTLPEEIKVKIIDTLKLDAARSLESPLRQAQGRPRPEPAEGLRTGPGRLRQ